MGLFDQVAQHFVVGGLTPGCRGLPSPTVCLRQTRLSFRLCTKFPRVFVPSLSWKVERFLRPRKKVGETALRFSFEKQSTKGLRGRIAERRSCSAAQGYPTGHSSPAGPSASPPCARHCPRYPPPLMSPRQMERAALWCRAWRSTLCEQHKRFNSTISMAVPSLSWQMIVSHDE